MRRKLIAMGAIALSIVIGGCVIMLMLGSPLRLNPKTSLDGVDQEISEILYLGSLAPNSHNSQPWKVTLRERIGTVNMQLDDARLLPTSDPDRRESYITLGCYIQTLQEAFEAYGYNADVEVHADGSAALTFERRKTGGIDTAKVSMLKKRHTDKRIFSKKPIRCECLQGLGENAVCYPEATGGYQAIADATLSAVATQADDSAFREELAQWMRYSDDEAREARDGITAEMLGLGRIMKALYYLTTNRESAEGDAFARQGIETAESQVRNCGAFLAITGGDSPEELVDVGRETVRVWLACTESNISVQPMSAALEVNETRAQLESELRRDLPIQMILRIGYVKDYGENMGVRRDLDEYVEVVG